MLCCNREADPRIDIFRHFNAIHCRSKVTIPTKTCLVRNFAAKDVASRKSCKDDFCQGELKISMLWHETNPRLVDATVRMVLASGMTAEVWRLRWPAQGVWCRPSAGAPRCI